MLPARAVGSAEAAWTASSMSPASIGIDPRRCSVVSANGPSVVRALPFRTRTAAACVDREPTRSTTG
jgi:hypothetical protein